MGHCHGRSRHIPRYHWMQPMQFDQTDFGADKLQLAGHASNSDQSKKRKAPPCWQQAIWADGQSKEAAVSQADDSLHSHATRVFRLCGETTAQNQEVVVMLLLMLPLAANM